MDVSIVWFRRDLRLQDNEVIANALSSNSKCLFIFVLDPWFFSQPEIGLLRVRFLFESLAALDNALKKHGNRLIILRGESVQAVTAVIDSLSKASIKASLHYNHDIQVDYGRKRDDAIQKFCRDQKVAINLSHNHFLLHDESLMKSWWKQYYEYQYNAQFKCSEIPALDNDLIDQLKHLAQFDPQRIAEELSLVLPTAHNNLFKGGEAEARQVVYSFLKDRVDGYRWKISQPYQVQKGGTSLLGPHLAFGTISSRTVFQAASKYREKLEYKYPKKAFDIATYIDRLRWRDSFTQRLWFHPELSWQNRFPEYDGIYNQEQLSPEKLDYFERWKAGETGFPLLDAAMKQLAQDGFINFRMRAMSATFLTINCGVSWHHGARHFMNCLVDGDIAINHWQWQMQAGITNPLSPTFRIYSPTKNLQDRDSSGAYVHYWLPETRGKTVATIIQEAKPMLDFKDTKLINGKIVSNIRKQVRNRIVSEKGLELASTTIAKRTVLNYNKFSSDRYERYIK